jgi:small GTP-binding protein
MNPIRVVFVGGKDVGKSSIFHSLCDLPMDANRVTIPTAFRRIAVVMRTGSRLPIALWDTAGDEHYKSLIPRYSADARVILAVFAVDVPDTLNSLPF